MPDEIEVILFPEPLFPCALHLPLQLDDILAQDEPGFEEAHQHPRRDGHEMLAAPCIANEDGAVLSGPEDAHALTGHTAASPARTRRCCARLRGRPGGRGNKG